MEDLKNKIRLCLGILEKAEIEAENTEFYTEVKHMKEQLQMLYSRISVVVANQST